MANIIIRKSRNQDTRWGVRKDYLHQRRKELAEQMKPGMFSVNQMKKGTDGFMSHEEQVDKYDKWKNVNEKNMTEWGKINREFKENKEESRVHSIDDIRNNKVIYD